MTVLRLLPFIARLLRVVLIVPQRLKRVKLLNSVFIVSRRFKRVVTFSLTFSSPWQKAVCNSRGRRGTLARLF